MATSSQFGSFDLEFVPFDLVLEDAIYRDVQIVGMEESYSDEVTSFQVENTRGRHVTPARSGTPIFNHTFYDNTMLDAQSYILSENRQRFQEEVVWKMQTTTQDIIDMGFKSIKIKPKNNKRAAHLLKENIEEL